MTHKSPLTYQQSGVSIDNGNRLIDLIKPMAARTRRPGLLAGLGGFNALFEIPLARYCQPVLVSGTDGVGTKLKLAITMQKHDTIGIDLVAMCVNDVLVCGAEPLFFLDYYATGALSVEIASQVIDGIARGCQLAGAALVGGETAEMPGMYTHEEYDLAGFCVGIVDKPNIIDGSQVQLGDALIGIASSGIHSNGYSLVRKILEFTDTPLTSDFHGRSLGETLLTPTRIYVKPILQLIQHLPVHALAHITGGGLLENIPRVLPDGMGAQINPHSWLKPPIFDWLQTQGNIADTEMYRTFNCGIGMVVCVLQSDVQAALQFLNEYGETAWLIGQVIADAEKRVLI